jgi:hypothetical protein
MGLRKAELIFSGCFTQPLVDATATSSSAMDYDLGSFDFLTRVLEPLDNPVWPQGVTVRSVTLLCEQGKSL